MNKKPQYIKTTLRLPRELWGKVRAQAFAEQLDAAALVIQVLEAYLKQKGGK